MKLKISITLSHNWIDFECYESSRKKKKNSKESKHLNAELKFSSIRQMKKGRRPPPLLPKKKGQEFASQREITPHTSTGIKSYGSIVFISIQLCEIEIRLVYIVIDYFKCELYSATNKILIKR